ncbi:MAG TPA: hypothetical protein VHR45_22870 [Thermoanaerobaculia bacterium]|nr:hypothetical protein [Thermoanaerobaculia bacterium]
MDLQNLTRRLYLPVGLAISGLLLVTQGCELNFGGGPSGSSDVDLMVPYHAQLTPYNCVPASIQMWAAFDRIIVPQDEIATFVHTTTYGTTPSWTQAGVINFTYNSDAQLVTHIDLEQALVFSGQITSIANDTPVLAVLSGGHAGMINGGSWHWESSSTGFNFYVWDLVDFDDPQIGPHREYLASDWMDLNTDEVISASSAAGAQGFLDEYGSSMRVRGSNYRPPGV